MPVKRDRCKRIVAAAFPLLLIFFCSSAAFSEKGLTWERVRLMPALTLSETYSDNIFLTHADLQGDFITTVGPKASLDFALAPQNILSLRYSGEFRFFERSDNFKTSLYQSGIAWTLTAPKGSTFKIDMKEDHNSSQPYSRTDKHKDYVEQTIAADMALKSLLLVDFAVRYEHGSRKFTDALYSFDDFTRDSATINLTYWAQPVTGFLLEYSFSRQNNSNLPVAPRMDSQTILAGIQWRPTAKLSGHLKGGYYFAKLDGSTDSRGFGTDTDVAYQASDVAQLSLSAFRRPVRSTIADRETGAFYVSAGGNLSVSYNRWSPLTLTLNAAYINNHFEQNSILPGAERRDILESAGLIVKYSPRDWLTFNINYQYRKNDSDISAYTYRDNRTEASLSLAI